MKKILALMLAITLIFSLCACANDKEKPQGNGEPTNSEGSDVSAEKEDKNDKENKDDTDDKNDKEDKDDNSNKDDDKNDDSNKQPDSSKKDFVAVATPENPTVLGTFYRNVIGADIVSNDAAVKDVDKKADALLKKIEDAPDTIKAKGKTYYLSANGVDTNDGLSPETPRKTYAAVYTFLKEGDAVLFNRGDIFRGSFKLVSGVSYGAYGKGIKPRLYGSVDGHSGNWNETSPGVWTFNQSITDYSNIVFNNGEAVGRPVQNKTDLTKKELNVFYSGARVSVYSPKGNPAEVFDSIEIVEGYSIMTGSGNDSKDIKVENLCIMFAGVHGFGSLGYSKNFTIENCVIGFCGGKNLFRGNYATSLGNAIEFMGGANNVTVKNNYLFQCYDTGITHQGPMTNTRSADFDNITYDNNLIEYCVWAIESWIYARDGLTDADKATGNKFNYGTVNITNNICRFSGWGWGSLDRPDKNVYADIIYTNLNHTKPLNITNNIFDRSRRNSLNLQAGADKNLLTVKNNQFIGSATTRFFAGSKDASQLETLLKNHSANVSGNTAKTIK